MTTRNPATSLTASTVLEQYKIWLGKKVRSSATYLTNAKTFLRTYRHGGNVLVQLARYSESKNQSLRSILKRFRLFLVEKDINKIHNDLVAGNDDESQDIIIEFLNHHKPRLKKGLSEKTYSAVLKNYFAFIQHNDRHLSNYTVEKFITKPGLSAYTRKLYKSVLKSFFFWVHELMNLPKNQFTKKQKTIQKRLGVYKGIDPIRIAGISVKLVTKNKYIKGSLDGLQREKLIEYCDDSKKRAIVSLMAWNGLRLREIIELKLLNCNFSDSQIVVETNDKKESIRLFDIPKQELKAYIKEYQISRGLLFPDTTLKEVQVFLVELFGLLRLDHTQHFSAYSLRHTTGQLMYDSGIRIELIQETLRMSSPGSALVYATKKSKKEYFHTIPSNY